MFKKGDFVVYGNSGVCEVSEITTLNMDGASKDRLYYILSPLRQKESRIFIPVDNDKMVIRPVLTKDEANSLINKIPEIEELWIGNDKIREEQYKETMKSCCSSDWIKIIKTLYVRKQERIAQGKKMTSVDEKYLRLSEENLYSELSVSLGIPRESMEDYITRRIMDSD